MQSLCLPAPFWMLCCSAELSTGDALEKQDTVTARSCPCPLSCLLILLPTVPPLLLPAQVLCGHRRQIRGPTALKDEEMVSFLSHQVPHLVHCTVILVLMKARW